MTPYDLIMIYTVFMKDLDPDVDPKDLVGAIALASMDETWDHEWNTDSLLHKVSRVHQTLNSYNPIYPEVMKDTVLKLTSENDSLNVLELLVQIWDEPNVYFRDVKFKKWCEGV
jgi:hypothetical protein